VTSSWSILIQLNEDSIDGNPSSKKIKKPPPVFVYGVINNEEILQRIRDIAEEKE
jgi:hypothetical protein